MTTIFKYNFVIIYGDKKILHKNMETP